jgi:hypothetical protein
LRAEWELPLLRARRFETVRPTPEGIAYVAENMRSADRAEVYASCGSRDVYAILRRCVNGSASACMAISASGVPIAIGGVTTVSLLSNIGSPWLLATDDLQLHRSALVLLGRKYTAAMLEQYECLENAVDARNATSVAWLQRIGFKLADPAPAGALGLPFRKFSIQR